MAWWKTGRGDDMIGDVAADAVARALDELVAERTTSGELPPTLPALLDTLGAALGVRQRIVATLTTGATIGSDVSRPRDIPLTQRLEAVFAEITGLYQRDLDRPPRPSELLACVDFVLASGATEYLDVAANVSIEHFTIEETQA